MKGIASIKQDLAAWIMAVGIVFGLAQFLTAILSTNPWEDHTYDIAPPVIAGMAAPHTDGREKMVCSSCHVVVPPKSGGGPAGSVLPIVQGTPAPHADGRENMECTTCHTILPKTRTANQPAAAGIERRASTPVPQAVTVALPLDPLAPPVPVALDPEAHEAFTTYRFQGKVIRIAGSGGQAAWGDVYALINDGINPPGWFDLAPRLFLQAAGCHIRPGVFVKGTAMRDPTLLDAKGNKVGLAYGMSIMVNGELCALRDSHLKGLWEENGGMDAEEQ